MINHFSVRGNKICRSNKQQIVLTQLVRETAWKIIFLRHQIGNQQKNVCISKQVQGVKQRAFVS